MSDYTNYHITTTIMCEH